MKAVEEICKLILNDAELNCVNKFLKYCAVKKLRKVIDKINGKKFFNTLGELREEKVFFIKLCHGTFSLKYVFYK